MNIDEIKKNVLILLDKINYKDQFVDSVRNFITSYNGNNEEDFTELMLQITVMLMYVQKLEVKANGFDKMRGQNDDFDIALNRIKNDFEKISANKAISTPAQSPISK